MSVSITYRQKMDFSSSVCLNGRFSKIRSHMVLPVLLDSAIIFSARCACINLVACSR